MLEEVYTDLNKNGITKNRILDMKRESHLRDANTIAFVVQNDLCTGCGTCASVCPNSAIEMKKDHDQGIYVPNINKKKCNNCGICLEICPGHCVAFRQLNNKIFGKQPSSDLENVLLGNYIKCYVGYSTDYNVRYNSASGGLITQLLLFALEEGIIDGALVTRMKKRNPFEPHPFIARTRKEIIEASKSKYCPVPANVALKEILHQKGKYATVGLPCQIHGLRKSEHVFKKLRERIVLHMGIFCSHTDTILETEYLLHHLGIKINDVAKIDYRGKGWPGMLSVKLKSGDEINVPFHDWINVHGYCLFAPSRCLLCCDHSAELADMSFADAWLPEFLNDDIGTSIVISRTEISEDMLRKAVLKRQVKLNEIDGIEVAKSQGMMRFKKNSVAVRFALFRSIGKKVPLYDTKLLQPRFIDWPRSGIIFANRYIASKRYLWGSLENIVSLQNPLKKIYTRALKLST